MEICGWKTQSMLDRYNIIVDEQYAEGSAAARGEARERLGANGARSRCAYAKVTPKRG